MHKNKPRGEPPAYEKAARALVHEFGDADSRFAMEGDELLGAMTNINNYKKITLALDIEFQSAIGDPKVYETESSIKGYHKASFIRELGVLVFLHGDNGWRYMGHVFVNFPPITKYGFTYDDMQFMDAEPCTVTPETEKQMQANEEPFVFANVVRPHIEEWGGTQGLLQAINDHPILKGLVDDRTRDRIQGLNDIDPSRLQDELEYIEKRLRKLSYEVYGRDVPKGLQKQFLKQFELYWVDADVKKRLLDREKVKRFMEVFSTVTRFGLYLVKGTRDLSTIRNTWKLFGEPTEVNTKDMYDIEVFNGLSRDLFGSSQLETTYNGLRMIKTFKEFQWTFDKVKADAGEKAHNPVVDSYMTFVVAVIMNVVLQRVLRTETNTSSLAQSS